MYVCENTDLQEEFCAVGNLGKIETGVPSNRSVKILLLKNWYEKSK